MNLLSTSTGTKSHKRDFVAQPPAIGDHITFNTPDDGVLAGRVSAFRTHLGNGEVFAWVELEHQWPGMVRGVPLRDIEITDGISRGPNLRNFLAPGNEIEFRKMYLCDVDAMCVDA